MEFNQVVFIVSLFFIARLPLHSARESEGSIACPLFDCGKLGKVGFPFSNTSNPDCGLAVLNCTESREKVQFQSDGKWYLVEGINVSGSVMVLRDEGCKLVKNAPASQFLSLKWITPNVSVLKCQKSSTLESEFSDPSISHEICEDFDIYHYRNPNKSLLQTKPELCSILQLPRQLKGHNEGSPWDLVYHLSWTVSKVKEGTDSKENDTKAAVKRVKEGTDSKENDTKAAVERVKEGKKRKIRKLKIKIGVCAGIAGILLLSVLFLIYLHRNKKFPKSLAFISRSFSPYPSSKSDREECNTCFPTPIFTYQELEEATNNFDSAKELGDGGFGTVYHGKLKDGRVVAVKRLYESNGKRVEQFVNEIQILSCLRHQNLVSLYGGTSRHSRELLLVYEYVQNGTVADHLHGSRANSGVLTWPIRMTIAKESADALAYLHASDIIHRDVKTNNILLDNNFHVKVADFGLSRLFPTNVTHVSTAPMGTPGYIDPEYHQCYQLNVKSDVYSFGVVLIELISSMPAVDIGRHRHEINLANMAINKIHNQALHELVDPSLGFESDYNVKRMVTMVAELAFRCLQQEKDMRPTMIEVLDVLKDIESAGYKMDKAEEIDIPQDVSLLKNSHPLSPISVTSKWKSASTTPNASG